MYNLNKLSLFLHYFIFAVYYFVFTSFSFSKYKLKKFHRKELFKYCTFLRHRQRSKYVDNPLMPEYLFLSVIFYLFKSFLIYAKYEKR